MNQVTQTGRFLRRWWPVLVAGSLMAIVVAFFGLLWVVYYGAHSYAGLAQREYRGDEVEALVQAVQDEHHTLRDRNHAIWALGQLRDARALPVLRKYYTGEKCQHEKFLCQGELKKALDLCSGRRSGPVWLQRALGWAFPKVRGQNARS